MKLNCFRPLHGTTEKVVDLLTQGEELGCVVRIKTCSKSHKQRIMRAHTLCARTHTRTHADAHTHTCKHTHMHTHTHAEPPTRTLTQIHTHTHIHTHLRDHEKGGKGKERGRRRCHEMA